MAKGRKLNEKQKSFCDYYIETLNAYQSALKAGYAEATAKTKSHKWLEKDRFKEYINVRMESKDNKRIASQDEVLEFLTQMMRGEIEEEQIVVENTGDYCSKSRIVTKQAAAKERKGAAELLGKRYKIFTDSNLNLNIGVQIFDDIGSDGDGADKD